MCRLRSPSPSGQKCKMINGQLFLYYLHHNIKLRASVRLTVLKTSFSGLTQDSVLNSEFFFKHVIEN